MTRPTAAARLLPAGQYALLCFIPDPTDGTPLLLQGMMEEFSVAPAS